MDQRSPTSVVATSVHGKCPVVQVKFSSDEDSEYKLISGGSDAKLCQWDLRNTNEPVCDIDIDRVPTKFAVTDKYAFVPCEIGHCRVVDLLTNEIFIVENSLFSYTISSVDYVDPDSNTVVVASWDGAAALGTYQIK